MSLLQSREEKNELKKIISWWKNIEFKSYLAAIKQYLLLFCRIKKTQMTHEK